MMKSWSLLICAAITAVCRPGFAAEGIALHGETVVRFASVEQGRELLLRHDEFTQSLSRFDLECRLNTNEEVTADDLLKFMASHVIEWTPEDRQRLSPVVTTVGEKLRELKLPLPPTVWLVKTTGDEEANAAYCRGPAIVLPKSMVENPRGLERLFAHELFHVLSNSNPELRNRLYELIGFHACEPIELPASLRDRKLTNPDAPTLDHYMTLRIDDKPVDAIPILFASVERYDPNKPGSLFRFLTFRLLALAREDGTLRVLENEQGPVLYEPISRKDNETVRLDSFFEQVGENTRYIIHPEEILADNFALMVLGTADLKSPDIVDRLRTALSMP
ncbi:MAG: hypothetical protein KDA38_11655 [Planctomycetales bacterium]|nr:hypothetical protein [Planctomycetales bacterium]